MTQETPTVEQSVGVMEAQHPEMMRSGGAQTGHDPGALELFIQEFNKYESQANLFAGCIDEEGFAWWDLVRYSVQFALCAERGIYAFRKPETKSLSARALSFFRQSTLLLNDAMKIAHLRGSRIHRIYVYGRRCKHLLDEIERSPGVCLVVGDSGANPGPHIVVHKRSIDFFVRIGSKLTRVSDRVVADCTRLDGEIKRKFGTKVDVRKIILEKYRQHKAACTAWSLILSRLTGVQRVGFVGDDTLKTLVYLANARNIGTREFQHGYMGKSHINYSYPELAVTVQTLPTEVMVHLDSGDIAYPAPLLRAAVAGAPSSGIEPAGPRDIDVLIGGSPTRAAEMISIIGALADKGLALAVKLHPIQSESSSGIRKQFTSDQVQVYSNQSDFVALARRARVYVPANPTSTTVFEAVESGAKLIVVNYGGVKMSCMNDGIVSGRVDSFQDLYDAVRLHLGEQVERTALC